MTNTTTAPHSIRCGNCHLSHDTVAEVKACHTYGDKATMRATALPAKPMALGNPANHIPAGHYALADLPGHHNAYTFFQIEVGKKGTKWDGYTFLSRLVGHPGSFQKFPVKGIARGEVLMLIAKDTKAAAKTFADEFSVCARCLSPLTDDASRALGLGPTCAEKF